MIFSPQEMSVAAPPSGISSEEWGCKNRELSALTSAQAGPWSMDMIPFFRPVLEALDNDDVEIVCIQKATQIAGSETVLTWLGKIAAEDPGPAMICFADEDTAKEFCKRRLQPMFRSSPVLSKLIIESEFGQESITLSNGFSLVMVWATSIARTASRPIRYLVLDEICKPGYDRSQGEGSVISRIFQRTETFPNRKIVMLSSVTEEGDNMDAQMRLCDEIREWVVSCPSCGVEQPIRFSRKEVEINGEKMWSGYFRFPEKENIREAAREARYQCSSCDAQWTTAEKNMVVSQGRAVPVVQYQGKPKRIGFHIPRTISFFPGGRIEALVETFLLAKNNPLETQSFINNALAEHWKHVIRSSEKIPIADRKSELPQKICPKGTLALTAAFDMQKFGFWFSVWAHRFEDVTLHSAMIHDGFVETFGQVAEIVFDTLYDVEGGGVKKVWRAALDTGGGKGNEEDGWSRTAEAYDFLRRNGRETIFGIKGDSRARDSVVWHSIIDRMPGKNGKSLGSGIPLYHMDTNKLKDLFFFRVSQNDDGPSPVHFHADTSDAYFRQILSEEKTRNTKSGKLEWSQISQRDNHQLDTAVMTMALLDDGFRGGIRLLMKAVQHRERKQQQQPQPGEQKKQTENPWLKGVIGNSLG